MTGRERERSFDPNLAAGATAPTRVARAHALRGSMTDAERKLWYALRDRRFSHLKFRCRVPIGPYIADFVCYDARPVIEVDGGQHAESPGNMMRNRWFATNGTRVLRFWNNDVLANINGVVAAVLEATRSAASYRCGEAIP